MAIASVDVEKLVDHIKSHVNIDEIKQKAKALRKGWDWNPFDKDDDEYDTAWEEFKNNIDLAVDFLTVIIKAVEKAAIVLQILEGGTKLEAAVKFADDHIKLPFFLEWLDDNILRFFFSFIVAKINDKLGHDWKDAGII